MKGTRNEPDWALSRARDVNLQNAGNGSHPSLCNTLAREAIEMGNVVYGRQGSLVYANSPESGPIRYLNTATIGAPSRPDNFHDEQARSTAEGLALATPASLPGSIGAMNLTKSTTIWSGIGGGIAGTMDAAGQYRQNGIPSRKYY